MNIAMNNGRRLTRHEFLSRYHTSIAGAIKPTIPHPVMKHFTKKAAAVLIVVVQFQSQVHQEARRGPECNAPANHRQREC